MEIRHLLVAEDDSNDVFIFKVAIKKATLPYQLHFVEDGGQAIDWFRGTGQYADRSQYPIPHVLITDLKMPRTSGFELLKWVRSQPTFASLPIIVLSSSDEPSDVTRAYSLSATSYFIKTIEYKDVIEFLRALTLSHG